MVKKYFLTLLFILPAVSLLAQNTSELGQPVFSLNRMEDSEIILSGNLEIDKRLSFNAFEPEYSKINLNPQSEDEKSPWLGALFSLVVPGAGEVYAESYWKAGIFVALEAAVITTAVIYNKKGNDETDTFEKFANDNWSPVRYAQWLNDNYQCSINLDKVAAHDFSEINACEQQHSELSHQLAPYGEQQYYEMIGKYHQFRGGWSDYTGGIAFDVSPMFHEYSGMRGKANDYYSVASTAVIGIYINHFLSAIDAYWSTTIYNKDLLAKITVENKQYTDVIELVPTLSVKFSF